jgi:hypothetical protein
MSDQQQSRLFRLMDVYQTELGIGQFYPSPSFGAWAASSSLNADAGTKPKPKIQTSHHHETPHPIICLLALSPLRHHGFPKVLILSMKPKRRSSLLENQPVRTSLLLNRWQIASGSLGIGCVILLIIGTALGATTRKHYDATSRRLGPTPTKLNGRKPHLMGKTDEEDVHSTLAA